MGFEECGDRKHQLASGHKHSKSFPDKRGLQEDSLNYFHEASNRLKLDMRHLDYVRTKKKHSSSSEVQDSLRQEILQLENRLQDQVVVRRALEKGLGCVFSPRDITNEIPMLKPVAELIKEIAVLELEIVHLEQYLHSLYRKAFDQQISSSLSTKDEKLKSPLIMSREKYIKLFRPDITTEIESSFVQAKFQSLANSPWSESRDISIEKLVEMADSRCQSSLSHHSVLPIGTSPTAESLGKAVRACHSQMLSMKYAQNASSNVVSLAEHLGTRISNHIPDTPNKISENMIKCMAAIYCKLADPPLTSHSLSSPSSSLSSMSAFSPKEQCDTWSSGIEKDSSFDTRLDNPFNVEGLKEFSGPYSTVIEVLSICRDSKKLGEVQDMLQDFRSLIFRLEEVDPRKMKHEEKLAFWINIHNALVMHAFLSYETPQNNAKRIFLLLKSAYKVGGHIVSAATIQNSILRCRMSRPVQWLCLSFSSRKKFTTGDERKAFGIDHLEPLLSFALSSGSHSDPAVRVYTPKRVFQELEVAKEEYIRSTIGIRNESRDQKILLPKIVETFAKDSGLCQVGVLEMIQKCVPESVGKSIKKCQGGKSRKSIEWASYSFGFRYLISKELVK